MFTKILKFTGTFLFMVAFSLLLLFVLINFMLGCESWDEQYWTAYNSCLTPTQFIGVFLP
jgi:hypothetical protein